MLVRAVVYTMDVLKLDANWKFLFWFLLIGLAFIATKSIADYYGYVSGSVVAIYIAFYSLAALIILGLWAKFSKDNYLN